MSPVHVAVLGDPTVYVPVAADPFWIGRDPACDLCLWDLRVSRRHARISRQHGEFVLSSEGRHGVFVRGSKVPFLPLRDADEFALTPPDADAPVRLRFENDLEDVFLPPRGPLSGAWLSGARTRASASDPAAHGHFDAATAPTDASPAGRPTPARERASGKGAVLQVLPAVATETEADAFLRLVAALGGAHHPSLARVLEGGIRAHAQGIARWIVTESLEGRPCLERVAEGPQPPIGVVRRLRGLAGALRLLHERGVVHGAVGPSTVLLRADGGATLFGFERALRRGEVAGTGPGPRLDAGWSAPESLLEDRIPTPGTDVHGLGALGLGMLAGRAPFPDAAGSAPRGAPSPLEDAGVRVPLALEDALRRAASEDPAERPDVDDLAKALAFAEVGLAGSAR